jgi:FkbH-like protein
VPKKSIEQLSYGEIIKSVEELEGSFSEKEPFRVSILRNITVDLMVPYLKYLCYTENIPVRVRMGNYDNILQDISGTSGGVDHSKSDLICVYLYPRIAARKIYSDFSGMSKSQLQEEIEGTIGHVAAILRQTRSRTDAPVLLHNFELPIHPTFGILDYQDSHRQVNVVRKINRRILDEAKKHESVYIVDMDLLQSRVGSRHLTDERFWHMARAPYSREGCLAIASEYIKFIRALRGRRKKCLVLDCDNTLWGGIIGEDGMNGISIGQNYPGSAYRDFQEAVLSLYNRGVLLALCSKNNMADVEEVLEKHPDMVLRKKHFVDMRINWGDKASNIRQIADDLNIGLDSLVFADDNEFEINLVNKMLPEVNTILMPSEPALYRLALEENGYFDSIFFSAEDRKRSQMYKAEAERKKARGQFKRSDIEDYLKYLDMELYVGEADGFHIPRISQLTQRTNQFNLTTKRYNESQIKEMIEDPEKDVFYAKLKDRFGESGVIGVAIQSYSGNNAFIDTFLLSCRAIGRGIENVLLKVCLDEAIQRDCENIFGTYIATAKNGQVRDLYPENGFSRVETEEDKMIYVHPLAKAHMTFPAYFKLIKVADVEYSKKEIGNE